MHISSIARLSTSQSLGSMQESMMQGCKETGEATNTKWDLYLIFDFSFDKTVKNSVSKNGNA